jgi:hypothetical protein
MRPVFKPPFFICTGSIGFHRQGIMKQSSGVWHHILSSKCESSSLLKTAVIVGPPSSGKKVVMGCLLGHNTAQPSAAAGAPLLYGHSSVAVASGCEANLEVFTVGCHAPLLSVVFANSTHLGSSDLVVAICVDVTLEDTCVHQCQQLVDEVSQCWSATHADASFKPSVVIFACKVDLLHVSDARWDVISARLRLLALNCGAAFAAQSSPSGCATCRQVLLASMQLASWPAPSAERISFFVPPNHDSAASLRAVLEVLGTSALSFSSSSSKLLDDSPLSSAHPVAPDDDQVGPCCSYVRVPLE